MRTPRLLLGALLVAATASAEVRLVAGDGGPALIVRPVSQGTWTPQGVPDTHVVNPDGDRIGDGYPAQATANARLVAAWQRPASSSIVVLSATGPETSSVIQVATSDAVGMPIVMALDSGFLVTWQTGTAVPGIEAVVVTEGNVSATMPLAAGRLIDVFRTGDSVHVVGFDVSGHSLNIAMFPTAYVPNPMPIPIGRVPLHRTFGAAPLEASPAPGFVTSPDTWRPCAEVTDDRVLLGWQAGRSVIGRVTLESDGIHGVDEFVRGPNGACPAVLNAASRH